MVVNVVKRYTNGGVLPLENLLLFFPAELFQQIVSQTNLYYGQNLDPVSTSKKWVPIDLEEVKAFLLINIAMGILNLPDTKSYWSERLPQVP